MSSSKSRNAILVTDGKLVGAISALVEADLADVEIAVIGSLSVNSTARFLQSMNSAGEAEKVDELLRLELMNELHEAGVAGLEDVMTKTPDCIERDTNTTFCGGTLNTPGIVNLSPTDHYHVEKIPIVGSRQDVPHKHRNRPQHGHRITRTRK